MRNLFIFSLTKKKDSGSDRKGASLASSLVLALIILQSIDRALIASQRPRYASQRLQPRAGRDRGGGVLSRKESRIVLTRLVSGILNHPEPDSADHWRIARIVSLILDYARFSGNNMPRRCPQRAAHPLRSWSSLLILCGFSSRFLSFFSAMKKRVGVANNYCSLRREH